MNRIKNFTEFSINEEVNVTTISSDTKFTWQFPEGVYKMESIDPKELAKLRLEIIDKILKPINEKQIKNGKTVINLVASTSVKPLSDKLKAELKAGGFYQNADPADKSGNSALGYARLATVEKLLLQFARIKDLNPANLSKSVEITRTVKANAGVGATFQFIAATIETSGELIADKISCKRPAKFDGKQGTKENNYLGFDKLVALEASANTKIPLTLDPLTIPDCFFVYYDADSYFLTPFLGEKTGSDPERNFLKELNNIKEPLLKGIINVIASKNIPNPEEYVKTRLLNKDGSIKILSENTHPDKFKREIIKKFGGNYVELRVFSPLTDTKFNIYTNCQIPTYDLATGEITGYTAYRGTV
jgi:hypothetical protein